MAKVLWLCQMMINPSFYGPVCGQFHKAAATLTTASCESGNTDLATLLSCQIPSSVKKFSGIYS